MSTAITGTGTDAGITGSEALEGTVAVRSLGGSPSTLLAHEPSLSRATRLHSSLLGFVIALIAVAICLAAALLIATGPFHTSLGSLV